MKNTASKTGIAGLIAALLASVPLLANEDRTIIYEIADGPGVYLQAPLPHNIYRYSDSSQLNDLLVIDSDGNSLPSRIITAPQTVSSKGEHIPLTFFPVSAGSKPGSWVVKGSTRVQIDERAIAISMGQDDASQVDENRFYLIDLRERDEALQSLELNWSADESSQYLHVEVSGSNDLQSWIVIASDTLVQLNKDSQTLLRNKIRINLAAERYDYLRIRFPTEGEVQLTDIQGHLPSPVESLPPLRWQFKEALINSDFLR